MQIHLIRHGEVENPGDAVYADIPGFRLSPRGRSEAAAAGKYLAGRPPRVIVSSPLDRAVETSQLIAEATGAQIATDDRLTEWGLAVRWRGATWASLPSVFPGELEAYLEDPTDLPFSPESITEVAARTGAAVADWTGDGNRDIAFVSHEDPIHATYLHLTGKRQVRFHEAKPGHCTVLTLQPDEPLWRAVNRWDPPQ